MQSDHRTLSPFTDYSKAQLKTIFGWSSRLFSSVILKSKSFDKITERTNMKILEIGASSSCCSLIFDHTVSVITVSAYSSQDLVKATETLNNQNYKKSKYHVTSMDAFDIAEQYDVIIMKSVLGGLFRVANSDRNNWNEFLQDIVQKNLTDAGYLITIDNGQSFFEPLLKNLGSRKNNWRYFLKTDFDNFHEQVAAGFLTIGALETRLGKVGHVIDTIIYKLDSLFSFFDYPTVIMTSFKKDKH